MDKVTDMANVAIEDDKSEGIVDIMAAVTNSQALPWLQDHYEILACSDFDSHVIKSLKSEIEEVAKRCRKLE